MSRLIKQTLIACLPSGAFWAMKDGGHWDKLLDGYADNYAHVQQFMTDLSTLRNPSKTTMLDDLERELAILPETGLTEAVRRARLSSVMFAPNAPVSDTYLESRLRDAGFDVYVHANDPQIDPNDFLDVLYGTIAGESGAQAGESLALAGAYNSDLVIAGRIYNQVFKYTSRCGNAGSRAGRPVTYAGSVFFDLDEQPNPALDDSDRWSHVFFVGGHATRNLMLDGDCELAGTEKWRQWGNGTIVKWLTRKHSGLRSLHIKNASTSPNATRAYQFLQQSDETSLTLSGWVYPSATSKVQVRQSANPAALGVLLWESSNTTAWQSFSVAMSPSDGRYISLGHGASTAADAIYVDDMAITDTTATAKTNGDITAIAAAQIPATRRDEFLRSILRWKPMHSWGLLVVEWT